MTLILPQPDDHFTWIPAPWQPGHAGPGADPSGRRADGVVDPDAAWVLQCRPLAAVAPHFFTTRALQLRNDSARAPADWARVAAGIGVPPTRLQRMRQVHGCATMAVGAVGADDPEADALITNQPEVALVVRVADCVPLLIADPRRGAVAAVHAGWRGTAAGIPAAAVRRLQREYGCDPADLLAAIGPAIGACCYQVGPDVRHAFQQAGHPLSALDRWFTPDEGDRWRLDTWASNRDQLIAAGLSPARVYVAGLCTRTHVEHFSSYRVEGAATGRNLGVIRMVVRKRV